MRKAAEIKPDKRILALASQELKRLNFLSTSGNVGHGISYSQLEEIDTALCLQKLARTPEDRVPLSSNIYPGTNTVLAFDNIHRLEGTLSRGGTLHRVNGIAVQPVTYSPDQKIVVPKVDKTKKRPFSASEEHLPIYNVSRANWPPLKEK